MKEIKTVSVIGLGALGMLFGNLILSAGRDISLSFVADSDRIEKYKKMHFTVNGEPREFPLTVSTDAAAADLVIVAVKAPALNSALDTMKNCVGPDTIIVSLMNGITSEEIIGARYGMDRMIYCVGQGMDAVKFEGDLSYSKCGEWRIGILDDPALSADREKLDRLTRFLDRVHIPYAVEDDILYRLWGKFMLNVGINQTCMVYGLDYGGVLNNREYLDICVAAMEEVRTVAAAEGIFLSEEEVQNYIDICAALAPTNMPSMRQDGLAKRPSEVELFAGAIRSIAAKHDIPVPINDMLYEAVKEIEASY